MICLEEIIKEAKCCSGNLTHKVIKQLSFGNEADDLMFDLMRLNAYIRTLQRNVPQVKIKKDIVYQYPKKVDINSLKKNKNVLYLNPEPKVVCTEIKIQPCLSDSEIKKITEEIRLLCSNCNCNC